jgi:hypothetical protein
MATMLMRLWDGDSVNETVGWLHSYDSAEAPLLFYYCSVVTLV